MKDIAILNNIREEKGIVQNVYNLLTKIIDKKLLSLTYNWNNILNNSNTITF